MPPKMKLPIPIRPRRRSQRVKRNVAASSAPVTIIIDEIEDAPAVADVPDKVAVADVPDDVPIAAFVPGRLRQRNRAKKKQKTAGDCVGPVNSDQPEDEIIVTVNESVGPVAANLAEDVPPDIGEKSDDCEVSDAEIWYSGEDSGEDGDGNRNNVGACVSDDDSIEALFREDATEGDECASDDDNGDDIWDDGSILDPINGDADYSEAEDGELTRKQPESAEEYLSLGKTFNCSEDFKTVVLWYSLKTKNDIV